MEAEVFSLKIATKSLYSGLSLAPAIFMVQADKQGKFTFENVPPGTMEIYRVSSSSAAAKLQSRTQELLRQSDAENTSSEFSKAPVYDKSNNTNTNLEEVLRREQNQLEIRRSEIEKEIVTLNKQATNSLTFWKATSSILVRPGKTSTFISGYTISLASSLSPESSPQAASNAPDANIKITGSVKMDGKYAAFFDIQPKDSRVPKSFMLREGETKNGLHFTKFDAEENAADVLYQEKWKLTLSLDGLRTRPTVTHRMTNTPQAVPALRPNSEPKSASPVPRRIPATTRSTPSGQRSYGFINAAILKDLNLYSEQTGRIVITARDAFQKPMQHRPATEESAAAALIAIQATCATNGLVVREIGERFLFIGAEYQAKSIDEMGQNLSAVFAEIAKTKTDTEPKVPLIKFECMPLGQVLDFYSELVGRSILRPSSLPVTRFITFLSHGPLTKTEAKLALETTMAMNGITVMPIGEKFVKVVSEEHRAELTEALANKLSQMPKGDVENKKGGMVPYVSFDNMPLGQVLDFYSDLAGRVVLRPATLPITTFISFKSRDPLTREEAMGALEAVMALNHIAIIPAGEKFVLVQVEGQAASARTIAEQLTQTLAQAAPVAEEEKIPAIDLRNMPASQAYAFYLELGGKKQDEEAAKSNFPSVNLKSRFPLSKAEIIAALEAEFDLYRATIRAMLDQAKQKESTFDHFPSSAEKAEQINRLQLQKRSK